MTSPEPPQSSQPPQDPLAETTAGPMITAPRHGWMTFLLVVVTFTVYAPFWFFGRARDLKALGREKLKPWLWFISPLFVISLPFSVPILGDELRRAGKPLNVAAPRFMILIGVGMFTATAGVEVYDRLAKVPSHWTWLIMVLVWGVLIAIMQRSFSRLAAETPNAIYRGTPNRYSVLEWLIVIPGVCGFLLASGYTGYEAWERSSLTPVAGEVKLFDNAATIEMPAQGWVLNTALEEDEVDVELIGPALDQRIHIERFQSDQSISALVDWHYEAAQISTDNCTEERYFRPGTAYVLVEVACSGRALGDPAMWVSRIVESEKTIYMLTASLSATRQVFTRQRSAMLSSLNSFKVK